MVLPVKDLFKNYSLVKNYKLLDNPAPDKVGQIWQGKERLRSIQSQASILANLWVLSILGVYMHLKANLTKETFLPLKLELYINNEHELMYLFMMFNCASS